MAVAQQMLWRIDVLNILCEKMTICCSEIYAYVRKQFGSLEEVKDSKKFAIRKKQKHWHGSLPEQRCQSVR